MLRFRQNTRSKKDNNSMASMASVPAQSLECVICQELYDEPKQLSCTHTFCQKCLADLLDFNIKGNKLTCPVCRQTTQVEDGDVSKLQTNFPIKSLVEDLKTAEKVCTVCEHKMRVPAVAYCQTCGEYMCSSCLEAHGKWKNFRGHEVVDSEAIKSGKLKVKRLCKKHPQEEMEWVCSTCKVPICFRCRMLYHNGPNHDVEEVAQIQKALKDEAKTLQKEAEDTVKVIKDHIKMTKEENVKSCTMLDERVADVITAFEDSLENLTKQKDELIKKLQKCKEEMTGSLQDIEEGDLKLLNNISSTRDLITKGAAGFLEGESLVVHQRLCTELREMMNKADCDDKIPRGITEQAESIKFTSQSQQDLMLGELTLPGMDSEAASANPPRTLEPTHGDKPWNLKKVGSLPKLGYEVNDMAPTPDGRMAVCYKDATGTDLFSIDGLRDAVFKTVKIQSIGFLSDGRCSVIDTDEKFSLYSCAFERVPTPQVQIECSWVCVGKNNEILIRHYKDGWHMSIYRPDSREFKNVMTGKNNDVPYMTYAIRQMNHRPYYVGKSSNSIYVWDAQFREVYSTSVWYRFPGIGDPFPVVLEDDSILIAWVGEKDYHYIVTVDLYTHDLRYVSTVLQDFKLYGTDFHIAAFSTGEIAICDSREIHVFRKDYQV